ncbi:MAG: sigma-70 family RNA polymerase sigma factor [Pirellulaceae bacterium]|nr:sigma-70 family RNA polymerase sigma factor [Pirellulaceae bacterium]
MISEQELIRQSLAGDHDAFRELVDRFSGRLYSSMLHVVGSHDLAEDVVQETFVQAFVKLSTFQGHSQFFTWLYRIAFNNTLSRRRRRSHVSLDSLGDTALNEPRDSVEMPDARMLRDEQISLIHRALQALTDEHRNILVLREMQDLPYEEIAVVLDINIGTVRSRLSRARSQLKSVLTQMQAEQT